MISHILLATDGSEHSRRAADLAADLAAKYSAGLTILHVLLRGHVPQELRELSDVEANEQPPLALGGHYIDAELPREVRIDIADKILASARDRAAACGVSEIEASWVDGPAADRIIEAARDCSADLIVMGTRGVGDLKGLMLGSTSHKVMQLFDGNVLTVR